METRKRVAVIGAGCSGLTSIKACVEQGLQPVCFESCSDLGGLWRYRPERADRQPSIYESLSINTSKEMMAFSDFPVPPSYPPFLPHRLVLEYFKEYAARFDLLRHIRFNTTVEWVTKAPNYSSSGRWMVSYRETGSSVDDETVTEEFDGVMLCSGHHTAPYVPDLPCLDRFTGSVLHSSAYKRSADLQGKNVLVIGFGNSAVDIAVDASNVANKVYLSTRRGGWVVARMGPWGLPNDAMANTRFVFSFPNKLLSWSVEKMANFRFDHEAYGLCPKHGPLSVHPTINDELPLRIMQGKILVRPDVRFFDKTSVTCSDLSTAEVDVVIMATGYNYSYQYVDPDVLEVVNNKASLYKFTMPMDHPHPTLSVIGLAQPIGAIMPIAELQARWAASLLTGRCQLPERSVMQQEVRLRQHEIHEQYVDSRRHRLQCYWIKTMDMLASELGCKPDLRRLLLTDPALAVRCLFGPCVPAQYRLQGPDSCSETAKNIICESFSNTFYALRQKPRQKPVSRSDGKGSDVFGKLLLIMAFFVVLRWILL